MFSYSDEPASRRVLDDFLLIIFVFVIAIEISFAFEFLAVVVGLSASPGYILVPFRTFHCGM